MTNAATPVVKKPAKYDPNAPKLDTKEGIKRCPRCEWTAIGMDCDFCGLKFSKSVRR